MPEQEKQPDWRPPQSLLESIQQLWPRWGDGEHSAIVAVSGGADSVGLLLLLRSLVPPDQRRKRIGVAHVNHAWREQEADHDQEVVQELASSLGLECSVARLPHGWWEETQGEGWEAAARRLRYQALTSAAREHGARYIATGHTFDDQLETVLIRLMRGTGLSGLRGIPVTRLLQPGITLVRPMLEIARADLHKFVEESGVPIAEDASNLDPRFLRNRVRHELLPLLDELAPNRWRNSLHRLSQNASDYQSFVDRFAESAIDSIVFKIDQQQVQIELTSFRKLDPLVQVSSLRLIWSQQGWPEQQMTQAHWTQLRSLLAADSERLQTTSPLVSNSDQKNLDFPGGVHVDVADKQATLTMCN